MLQTRRKTRTNSPLPSRYAMPSLALILLLLTGCAQTPSAELPPIVRKPKATPLPAAILQIDTQPSMRTLSMGQQWLERSEAILLDGMQK